MKNNLIIIIIVLFSCSFVKLKWGFFAHQRINQHAVFTLPVELAPFYKKHILYIMEHSVDPDKRRYAIKEEAPRHYIDLDVYGDSAISKLPHYWPLAVEQLGEDSLMKHGIVPWHVVMMKSRLTQAFRDKDPYKILKISAEIGHYIGDAHVPLHTTRNYNGQLTGQEGIHGFWESRLPELFSKDYDFFAGKATYIPSIQNEIWKVIGISHAAMDSVLSFEKILTAKTKSSKKYVVDSRNGQNVKTYSRKFSQAYHAMLKNQVERQMRASIHMIGSVWYTAWIDAGQPNIQPLLIYEKGETEKKEEEAEEKSWLQKLFNVRTEN